MLMIVQCRVMTWSVQCRIMTWSVQCRVIRNYCFMPGDSKDSRVSAAEDQLLQETHGQLSDPTEHHA